MVSCARVHSDSLDETIVIIIESHLLEPHLHNDLYHNHPFCLGKWMVAQNSDSEL